MRLLPMIYRHPSTSVSFGDEDSELALTHCAPKTWVCYFWGRAFFVSVGGLFTIRKKA